MTLTKLLPVLATVLSAVVSAGCPSSAKPAPPPEGFVDVLDTIQRTCADVANSYECAKAVEQYRLGRGVSGVSRVGKRLSIAVASGAMVDLTDTPDPGAEDYVAYRYTEYLGCWGQHLIHRQFTESDDYLLVHAGTGARQAIPGVPVLAPDCARLAVVSGLPAAGSVLQIWRLTDTARPAVEWGYQPDEEWMPGIVSWTDSVRLEVPYTLDTDPQTRRKLKVRLYTDGWRVEP